MKREVCATSVFGKMSYLLITSNIQQLKLNFYSLKFEAPFAKGQFQFEVEVEQSCDASNIKCT